MPTKKQEVHRGFSLATPAPKGRDVEVLQGQINEQFRRFKIDRRIAEDGEFGKQTLNAARQVALLLGVVGRGKRKLTRNRVSKATQKLIRGRKRSRRERAAAIARKPLRAKLRKRYSRTGGKEAVAIARKYIGVTEQPAGSNWGPEVGKFIEYTGYGSTPVYWCGCFVAWCVGNAGAKIPTLIRLGFDQYITADANAGTNGLTAVSFDNARPGDIVVYAFPHIGLVERVEGDTLHSIEGNTSPGESGSQDNGGGVYRRTRRRTEVRTIARPNYK
jgi:hypothetical protein